MHLDALQEDDGDLLRSLSSFGGLTSLQEEDDREWILVVRAGLKNFWKIRAQEGLQKQTSAMVVCLVDILMD
jgi:hypothetical protein